MRGFFAGLGLWAALSGCSTPMTRHEEQLSNQLAHTSDIHDNIVSDCLKTLGMEKTPFELSVKYGIDAEGVAKTVELDREHSKGIPPKLESCVVTGFKKVCLGDQIGGPSSGVYQYRSRN